MWRCSSTDVNIAKDIKNTTKISHQPLSISYIGIKFLQNKVGNLEGKKALVIGYIYSNVSSLISKHLSFNDSIVGSILIESSHSVNSIIFSDIK